MLDKLQSAEKRLDEINESLSDIEVINDQSKYKALMKEHKQLTPIIEKYREYKKAKNELEEAEEILNEAGLDRDLKEMAQQQLTSAKGDVEKFEEELKILLLPRDPNDDRNVIIEIRGG
ncbi:MAG: PCRF domain-containing protein, partial [Ruminiclostridium sp.]|nr:PCRF domain-containing protein [Ruminiclostridium sp.]